MRCELDYRHRPEWCAACWEEEQKIRDRVVQRNILAEIRRFADNVGFERPDREIYRPQRAYKPNAEISVTQTVPERQRRGL